MGVVNIVQNSFLRKTAPSVVLKSSILIMNFIIRKETSGKRRRKGRRRKGTFGIQFENRLNLIFVVKYIFYKN